MAETFKFELVSPERLLMSGDVAQVVVPGSEGDFAVLPDHAPVLSTLRPGVLQITGAGSEEKRIFVRGGFAEAGPESLTVLAQQAIDLKEFDRERIAQEIKNAEQDLSDAKEDEPRRHAQGALDELKAIQAGF